MKTAIIWRCKFGFSDTLPRSLFSYDGAKVERRSREWTRPDIS